MNPRIAIVEKSKCHSGRCNHECIKHDPINKSGGEGFHLDEEGKATIAEEKVIEAHSICAKKCPFGAIKIVKLPGELDQPPMHQYGENGFRVFNLPIPLPQQVVGILGRNGIGKSTVLQIISGLLQPNLGRLDKDPVIADLIEFVKGSEAQRYFEQMRDTQMTYAFKPQGIELIPKQFSGTIAELLGQVCDDEQKINTYASRLGLSALLDRPVTQVSGGELQRAAIIATALKDAEVYFFDEPTSFLDIYQRLEVSAFIRELAQEKSVVVIEHDLIILDAIADTIHIAYGQESAFGVISGPKSTKNGINMYLDGFLPQENIRFRQTAIQFKKGQKTTTGATAALTSWPALSKKLGSFTLNAESGELLRHEVVGVLGQNGIGKTTFVKLLAGVEKSDSGVVDTSIKVSYKPQYLDTQNDTLVMAVLHRANTEFQNQLIRPLGLDSLFEMQLNQLSGGQLQRVAVAACLSADADLFLLDEPSAYLDAEQRLLVSKVIKDFMLITGKTAIVVDHDLLFIDYLSDRLFVFDGEPGVSGRVSGPFDMQEGMNTFLSQVGITFRRDEESLRPRANKVGSQMDQKQRRDGVWYYV